jgi:hypothetical protein
MGLFFSSYLLVMAGAMDGVEVAVVVLLPVKKLLMALI